ncbi:hypothetical protein [Rhodococcus jostii]|uniref:hypothetical protein n=1 Tax=Rhodococcus jostii TaxID=132919 RepID=UPI003632CD98
MASSCSWGIALGVPDHQLRGIPILRDEKFPIQRMAELVLVLCSLVGGRSVAMTLACRFGDCTRTPVSTS